MFPSSMANKSALVDVGVDEHDMQQRGFSNMIPKRFTGFMGRKTTLSTSHSPSVSVPSQQSMAYSEGGKNLNHITGEDLEISSCEEDDGDLNVEAKVQHKQHPEQEQHTQPSQQNQNNHENAKELNANKNGENENEVTDVDRNRLSIDTNVTAAHSDLMSDLP